MTASDLLRQTWDTVQAEASDEPGYYSRRIPLECGLPAYAGIVRPGGSRRLSLVADRHALRSVSLRDETKGYVVEVEPAPAGQDDCSVVHLTAKGGGFADAFTILAADILEQWTSHDKAEAALAAVRRRLEHWRRFFQRGSGGLSREEYVGLYTELVFLEALLDGGISADRSVEAWQGPLGANQDFLFGPVAIEIKGSTSNESASVRITNERQLDSTGLQALFLFHGAFDCREGSGRTLKRLVAGLVERLAVLSPQSLLVLEDRLLSAGYSAQVPSAYDDYGFTDRALELFEVRGGFPSIVEADLDAGVTQVSYRVNLAACSGFRVQMATVLQSVKGDEQDA